MQSISKKLYLLPLLFAPLAFGTVEFWSLYILEVLILIAFFATTFSLKKHGDPWLKVPGITPLFLILLFMLMQMIPLPPGIIKALSPAVWHAYSPLFQTGYEGWIPLSINRAKTLEEFFRYACYTLFYITTIQQMRSGNRIKPTLLLIIYFATGIAVLAILQQFTSHGNIYWFRHSPGGHPGGPWVNINQYAAFIEAICPFALALFLLYRPRGNSDTFRQKLVTFFSSPRTNRYILLGTCFIILFSSVLVTLCRGGILTLTLSLILFTLLSGHLRKGVSRRKEILVIVALATLVFGWFGWDQVLNELGKTINTKGQIYDSRFSIWQDTFQIIKDYPWFGAGFGSYMDLNPSYRSVVTPNMVDHAHNEYLELLTDGGILTFLFAAWFVLTVLTGGWKWLKRRHDTFARLLGIGAITAICAMLMHCIVDFNLHNGADGLYFFFLCGLLVSITRARFHRVEVASLLEERTRVSTGFTLLCTLLLTCALLSVQTGKLLANSEYTKVQNIYISSCLNTEKQAEVRTALVQAAHLAPFESFYPAALANLERVVGNHAAAGKACLQAVALRPLAGHYLMQWAAQLPKEQSDKAVAFMQEGYKRALNKNALVFPWCEWLLRKGRREEAKQVLQDHFKRYPSRVRQARPLLKNWKFSKAEMEDILPHR
ncbi:O-antigen ligase family protein [Desulforhopalus vacuolatus]|uniref:O-antigen ligase family protein n=1 Tax=Desulforhopalus vacuolatus TaxID=40414 RepID=UPI0019630D56|nr:O-antigen ligase family protein [Desulforhopalus vacuolatus]MBM9519359.1 O-antigen ligase family protein [Desulforhopalus vacuolatus]